MGRMGTIKKVDQFNTEKNNIPVDIENITDNRIQRKKKKHEKKEVYGNQKLVCLGDIYFQILGVESNMESEKEDALVLNSVVPQCRLSVTHVHL